MSNKDLCRICLSETSEKLISPCSCTSYVHESCLNTWNLSRTLPSTRRDEVCEICNLEYNLPLVRSWCQLIFDIIAYFIIFQAISFSVGFGIVYGGPETRSYFAKDWNIVLYAFVSGNIVIHIIVSLLCMFRTFAKKCDDWSAYCFIFIIIVGVLISLFPVYFLLCALALENQKRVYLNKEYTPGDNIV